MKNIFIALFIIIITASCTSHSGYTFTGEVPEAWEGKQVELILSDISVPFVSDSAVIRNGRFVMKGNVDIPRYAQVAIYLDPEDKFNRSLTYRFPVFIENSNIVVTCDNSNIKPVFNVEGSAAHEEYKLYNEFIRPLEEDRKEKFREYGKVYYQQRDLEKGVELAKDVNYRLDKIKEARLQFVKDNPESSVSLHILRESWKNSTEMSVDEMSVLVDLLSDNLRQSVAGADFMNSLSSKKMIVGKPHPNVELIDVNGEKKMISDFVTPGRYTLIELWASWCSPCKAEFPFLKRAYEKYNPKGFDIVSISIDTDENDWKKALEEERMPWPQLLDKERVALRACETSAVPTCILVDPTGKIYALEARGGWLDMILQTIYPN